MTEIQTPPVGSYRRRSAPDAGPPSSSPRRLRFRLVSVALVLMAVVVVVLFSLGGGHHASTPQPLRVAARAVSPAQLRALAASVRHPVFWLGPKAEVTYELSRRANGTIFVRYLPRGVAVGVPQPYLTVATYPFEGAYAAVRQVAAAKGSTRLTLPSGGLAMVSAQHPDSVHIAYPGIDYQVEVFDPVPGHALEAVAAGELAAFGSLEPTARATPPRPERVDAAPRARVVTLSQLHALAASVEHPVYWLGPRRGYAYELTEASSGQLYVRYLPRGVAAGSPHPYVTVGTYPFHSAFAAVRALAKEHGATTLHLRGGGLGVVSPAHPKSVHLADPGSNYEVEVFAPTAGAAERIVAAGEVASIR